MEPGEILENRYEVRRAWRRVYLLLDLSSGRYVSARPSAALACPQAVAQLRALAHPCLPRVFGEIGEGQGRLTLFEYIPGIDLETRIQRGGGALDARVVCAIGAALACTLAFLHEALERPLVHLDIKPPHVILADGIPCLIDFGAAVLLDRPTAGQAVAGETAAGDVTHVREATPVYAAPETAVWRGPCIQSDIYSLGVTLFRALGGTVPPAGRLPDLRDLPQGVPDDVRMAVGRCLMVDPASRYASMGALAADLRAAMTAELCS